MKRVMCVYLPGWALQRLGHEEPARRRQALAIEVLAVFPEGPPVRFVWQGAERRVAHWWGPERIETGWWRGEDVQRDYYVMTTQAGSRFWMFRRGDGGWFLHGCFD